MVTVTVHYQDRLEQQTWRFAKLELSLGSKPTGYSSDHIDMLCIHNHTLIIILYVL